MNDREFGNKIKQELNYGLGRLDARVIDRLRLARERALDVFAAQEVTAQPFALAGHQARTQHTSHHTSWSARKWLPLAMLVLALVGGVYWQHEMQRDEDVDAALLASDMPFNLFTDRDFHSWLDSAT